ncbi:hypothetical protein JCM1841_000995 [Sporobolomyces salmonicolor]
MCLPAARACSFPLHLPLALALPSGFAVDDVRRRISGKQSVGLWLGFWVTGTTSFIETYALPSAYDSHTNGTFTWECAIVGGVVGGIVVIAFIAALLLYLRRKHDAAIRSAADGLSVYSAPRSEKWGSMRYAPGPGSTATGPAAGGGGMVVHPSPPGT